MTDTIALRQKIKESGYQLRFYCKQDWAYISGVLEEAEQ